MKKKKGNINGVGPLGIRTEEGESTNLKGGKDNPQREVSGMTYASEETLEPIKFILQEVSSQEYATIAIEIGEQIQIKEHRIQEVQQDQTKLTSQLQ
jgi:hypothetical protein